MVVHAVIIGVVQMTIFGLSTVAAKPQTRRGSNLIRLDAMKVTGRVEKPQVFFIFQRTKLEYQGIQRQRRFVSKIIESIDSRPF
jgi:hypothetical protein